MNNKYGKVDYHIFSIAVFCCLVVYLPLFLFRNEMDHVVHTVMNTVTFKLDWVFEAVCFVSLIFCFWLIFGKYGKIKLGKNEDVPEFSTFTWVAMFFCAGIGAGAIYWAFLEPLSILNAPPFGLESLSSEARIWSITYPCFHWSLTPWAIFAVPGITFAYVYYNHGQKHLRASYACAGVIGKQVYGPFGKAIDIFVIVGLIGGLATSLGFVFPMLSGLISQFFQIKNTLLLEIGIGAIFTLIYSFSCYSGLYSGIAKLSVINTWFLCFIITFIFFVGPSSWLISNLIESIANMLQNYLRMSFYLDTINQSGFPQTWTVFYWAWWLSWAVYIGLFMARISKGRTIRAFIANMLFTAGGGTALIFAIIGGYSEYVNFSLGIDLVSIFKNSDGYMVIYTVLETLPLAKIIIPFFIVVLVISQVTGIDSAAYTLANISCKEIGDGEEPPRWIRLFWSVIIFFTTAVLLVVGGMEVIKLSSILTSVPLLALQVLFMISLIRWLNRDAAG